MQSVLKGASGDHSACAISAQQKEFEARKPRPKWARINTSSSHGMRLDMEVRLTGMFASRLRTLDPKLAEQCTCSTPLMVSARGTVVEKAIADCWAKGTFDNPVDSLDYHFAIHGAGRTLREYTSEAARFFERYQREAIWSRSHPRWNEAFQVKKTTCGGYFTPGGRILSYWGFDEQREGAV
jgi:hypothetical protein